MRPVLHPDADDEFAEEVRYYSEVAPDLGERFYEEIERLIREACTGPQRFRQFDPPARRHFSRWFPYAVIYLEELDHVWIVAVMHMKRRPGYWKPRLFRKSKSGKNPFQFYRHLVRGFDLSPSLLEALQFRRLMAGIGLRTMINGRRLIPHRP